VAAPKLEEIRDGMEISVDELDALFRTEKVGAHASLTNKTLAIRGLVDKVFIRDHLDVRYIILTGAKKALWNVRCSFDQKSLAQLSRLEEGQAVVVSGKYDGYGKNIILKDCSLVR
jgi:hypothetical protein